jgi:hypothetical protein
MCLMLLMCGITFASAGQQRMKVTGTRVTVTPPPGFVAAKQFPGFQQLESGSSIMITEIPAPFNTIRNGMTRAGLRSRGMTLLSSVSARFAGLQGMLLSASQTTGSVVFHKWLGVFGTESATVMVVATFPERLMKEHSASLKQAVLSAQLDGDARVDPFEGLSFRIKEGDTLKISSRVSNMLTLTSQGRPSPVPPGEPLLIVGSAIGHVEIRDLESFSNSRILRTAHVNRITGVQGRPVQIGQVKGYEITANGKDATSGLSLALYQVIIPRGDTYYIVQGMVGSATQASYFSQFREIVASMSFVK